ncbi:di-heme oxidoredictase family protein [Martelella endophytica]|uniref:Thiol oxidoreductase n=1 Tax=Martelella endophytica TaxID=1486262 RepID=A0A0D5LNE2_MAREN|nr:di-heme oxidoredictase family protein [Martelella endophytica]AJY45744.1 thiol oxidoreductase [Martelella endophytica]
MTVTKRHLLVTLAAALAASLCFTAAHSNDWTPPSERTDLNPKDRSRVESVTRPTTDFSKAERFETMQGGAATSKATVNRDSFSHSSANITFAEEETFKLGNALFRKFWVSSPSSTQASDGLGPLFNSRSCQSCHLKDGRGHPPEAGDDASSMFLRLARPARTPEEQARIDSYETINFPDEVYGGQLQDFAVPGLAAEGQMKIEYTEEPFTLGDGTVVLLRHPTYSIADLAYGDLGHDTTLSPRVANQMIGLGLVQAIHPADILANADPDDADGDGISGRPAIVSDHRSGDVKLGRFGWKAQNATIRDQSSGAFSGDIGISTPDAPNNYGDCSPAEAECLAMPHGAQPRLGETEAPDPVMELVTFYSENLAVPARRDVDDPQVLRGKQVFYEAGCTSCHTPKFVTSRDAENPAHRFQLIWPYSDFLLHDMGEGLADGQQVGMADGFEWRTPPLWGTGLTETVNGHSFFLHDGRARNRTEAILWHGGEAEAARDNFANAPADDREALIKFLESL